MKVIYRLFLVLILASATAFSASSSTLSTISVTDQNDDWKECLNRDGIKVEYKYQVCNNATVKNQVLVLFRFTNTSTDTKSMSWSIKEYRDGECTSCDLLDDPEYKRSMVLAPGQVIAGDGTSTSDYRVFLFSNFIKLVPGMTGEKLTKFEFTNVEIETITD